MEISSCGTESDVAEVKRVECKIKPQDPIFLMNILFRRMILRVSKKFKTRKETDLASALDLS